MKYLKLIPVLLLTLMFVFAESCVKDEDLKEPEVKPEVNTVVLNEIMAAGDPDYIELYNKADHEVDISGYKLHDKDPSEAYTIPEGTIISGKGFWTLDCDGSETTLFKISKKGENVSLLNKEGKVIDNINAEDWPAGHSGLIGRVPDGGDNWRILEKESKGKSNGN